VIALAGSVLAASLLGSAHCAGMCGGFVCFFAADGDAGARRRARLGAHVAYHLGRLISYATLGLLAGALGAGVTDAAAQAGVARGATLLAGALMIAWGGARLLAALGVALPGRPRRGPGSAAAASTGLVAGALRRVAGRRPEERALVLGLATTLLPCGWLFAFVATAAGTGRPGAGALVMAVFWLGTLPALAAVGVAARLALGPLARRLPAITAAVVLVLGLLTLAGRTTPVPAARATTPGPAGAAADAGAPAGVPGAAHAGCR
jgi:sulfite exporter TauE/SafE